MRNKFFIIFITCTIIFYFLLFSDYALQKQYGLNYNTQRIYLNIPVIEEGWKYSNTGKGFIMWNYGGQEFIPIDSIHIGKEIKLKNYKPVYERDTYVKGDLMLVFIYHYKTGEREYWSYSSKNNIISNQTLINKEVFDSIIDQMRN